MIHESEETRLNHIRLAVERDLPELAPYAVHRGKWHICAGGPSLKKEVHKIKRRKGTIVSVNGTHDYLISRGLTPDVCVIVDPQEHTARFVEKPKKGIIYIIAAHCHPKVFDNLEGQTVLLWYPMEYELPTFSVPGGTTVGLRAINIGYTLGYRNIHLWGFDGCVKETHHAYPQGENDGEPTKTVCYDGIDYTMTDWLCAQADDFEQMIQTTLPFNLTVHTDGLIQHMEKKHAS